MKYNIIDKLIFIAVLILLSTAVNASAEDEEGGLSVSADAGIFSKYIWRGYDYSDNIVVQPSLTLDYKGFSLNAWANIDTDPDDGKKWNETDWTLSYETSTGPLSLGAGYIYYDPRDADDTSEIYIYAGYETLLSPTLTIYKDIDLTPGYYFNLGLSHSIEITEDISMDFSGGLGYYISHNDSIIEEAAQKRYKGFQDGLISASMNIPVSKSLTVSPSISHSFALSKKARVLLGASSNTFGGITLTYSF
jgi:hypothetical protein